WTKRRSTWPCSCSSPPSIKMRACCTATSSGRAATSKARGWLGRMSAAAPPPPKRVRSSSSWTKRSEHAAGAGRKGRGMRVRAPDGEKRRLALAVCRAAIVATVLGSGCGGPKIHVAPNDPEYEYRLGKAELQRKHWVAAEEHLKRFVDLHPGHAKAD